MFSMALSSTGGRRRTRRTMDQEPFIQPSVILAAIEVRAPLAGSRDKAAGQAKSELSVLIHELDRTQSYVELGFKSLPKFAASHGIKQDVLKKYRAAGVQLFQIDRPLFEEVLRAIGNKAVPPSLPSVSSLKEQAGLRKRLGPDASDLVLQAALRKNARGLKQVADFAAYGNADGLGRRVLSDLDQFVSHARRIEKVLQSICDRKGGFIEQDALHRRLRSIDTAFERVGSVAGPLRHP